MGKEGREIKSKLRLPSMVISSQEFKHEVQKKTLHNQSDTGEDEKSIPFIAR